MSGNQNRQARQNRRADKRRENDKRQGQQYPELVQNQNELEGRLEKEMNRIKFRQLEPRSEAQARCIHTIEDSRLTFVVGPAGTGKTFISVSLACEALERGEVERIVLTRPMVGCEEDMGFLPGTEWEKFKAWIGPGLEVLEGKLGASKVETYVKYKKIVGAPLMTMRGSTFRNSFVILDEAQNSSKGQMKMFLTRLGSGSKVVVTGDLKQSDRAGNDNGLADAVDRFRDSKVMGHFAFEVDDIERDPLVREVVLAYRD